jgi:hypothetical protein
MADIFQSPKHFVAFYSYERSVEYPNGHRNVYFIERGNKIMTISGFEQAGVEGANPLYWYLRQNKGLTVSHTSGRTSGTDWRDNDAEIEPLVEIFQGMRDTYEYVGAPRPKRLWSDFLYVSKPIPRASSDERAPRFRGKGFVWEALAKGIKFGFISSSDHLSCHLSYACIIAEKLELESLFEAMKARRTYAATDNIILDVRFEGSDGEHLMGEKFTSNEPVKIKAIIIGTDIIKQIDIIKNNSFVYTIQPNKFDVDFEYVDSEIQSGESYYYLRVIQKNGEMAWGSPVWVTFSKGK